MGVGGGALLALPHSMSQQRFRRGNGQSYMLSMHSWECERVWISVCVFCEMGEREVATIHGSGMGSECG